MKFCKCFIYLLQFTTLCAWLRFRTISTRMLSYFFLFIKRWCWLNINLPWSISIKMCKAKLIPLKGISNMFSSKILILRRVQNDHTKNVNIPYVRYITNKSTCIFGNVQPFLWECSNTYQHHLMALFMK